jgi:predicted TIM-barrel fold metal-dependent hydrolase
MIENIEWLSETDRKKIFEDNARAVFKVTVK